LRVLLVEDDALLGDGIRAGLKLADYAVDWVRDGESARLALLDHDYDACVLDLGLPKKDGLAVLRDLRARGATVPVLVLTARDTAADKIAGLDAGADDYLVKPFELDELNARIRAVLRRIRPGLADDRLTHGDIVIDRVAHRVRRAGQEIHLGPTEFRLLDHLMQHPGRVFSREQLLDAVWGSDVYVEARTVDVHVGRLRKALNIEGTVNPIRTVRSAGYSLDLGG
jgi:two-component system phosphate regulon response regulator PhoB